MAALLRAADSSPKKCKHISKKGLSHWEKELTDSFDFDFDELGEKAILAKCKVCKKHCNKIQNQYRGKIVQDVISYGLEGTRHILKPNLRRHIESESHRKCLIYETGEPISKKQRTLTSVMGNSKKLAEVSLKPLLTASLYLGRKEKPYAEFPDLLETVDEMGLKTTSAFSNDKAAKVFNHTIAEQMRDDLRHSVSNGHFFSWMIDGSAAAKRRLTYEAELFYVRTAYQLRPNTELFSFIPMQRYGSVNAENLFHAVLKELLVLSDKAFEKEDLYLNPVDEVPLETLVKKFTDSNFHLKNVGAGADGASVNFGCKTGLMQRYKSVCSEWIVCVHCFSHRLELAAGDALKDFTDVDEFMKSLYLHFRNSSKEWSLVLKLGDKLNIGVTVQPRSFGTRFLPHRLRAILTLRYNWGLYVQHFSDVKEQNTDKELCAKATAWLKNLLNFSFLAKCRVYEDIIQKLSATAKIFQTEDARSISDAARSFQAMKIDQELLADEPGECEQDLWKRLREGETVEDIELLHLGASTRSTHAPTVTNSCKIKLPCKVVRHGAPDPAKPKSRSKFMDSQHTEPLIITNVVTKDYMYVADLRKKAVTNLNRALDNRYTEFEKQTEVLSKIKFIDTTLWPKSLKDLSKYCTDEIQWLLDHFREPLQAAGIESDVEVLREFKEIKMSYGPRLSTEEIKMKPREFWPWLYTTDKDKFRHFLLLVELILCIPFSTAVVERGFSAIRRILTDWRATLGTNLVADCLHFSTRKKQLESKVYRTDLVNRASDAFLNITEQASLNDNLGMLTKRRVNLILSGLDSSDKNGKSSGQSHSEVATSSASSSTMSMSSTASDPELTTGVSDSQSDYIDLSSDNLVSNSDSD